MILIRRIAGQSMLPRLRPGVIVVATAVRQAYAVGDVVIASYNELDIIKRITNMRTIGADAEIFLTGDNPAASTDSRQFGWLNAKQLKGKVIWPRQLHQNSVN